MDEILSEPPVRGPPSAKWRHVQREQHWPIGATLLGVRERSYEEESGIAHPTHFTWGGHQNVTSTLPAMSTAGSRGHGYANMRE